MKERKKSAATHIGTIEKKYGRDSGVQLDKHLGTYLREKGYPSLSKLIKSNEGKKGSAKK